jgi:hypothetical protein
MKRPKLLLLGLAVVGSTVGGLILKSSQANANSGILYCDWNGTNCSSPLTDKLCHCDDQGEVDQ